MKTIVIRASVILLAAGFAHGVFADGKDYHGQDLKGKSFAQGSLNKANFADAALDGTSFNEASVKSAIFKGASLDRAQFQNTDATGADFREITGGPNFYIAKLDKANFEGVAFSPSRCSLVGADLQGAKISGSVSDCDFTGADLRGANLRGMSGGETRNIFKGALYDDDTAWPDGFDPKQAGAVLSNKADDKTAATTGKPADAGTAATGGKPSWFSGAGGSVAGKYVGEDNKDSTFTLNDDGTMVIHEGGQDMNGTYKVDGDTITLTIGGESVKAKVSGKELLPVGGNGQKMMKQ